MAGIGNGGPVAGGGLGENMFGGGGGARVATGLFTTCVGNPRGLGVNWGWGMFVEGGICWELKETKGVLAGWVGGFWIGILLD